MTGDPESSGTTSGGGGTPAGTTTTSAAASVGTDAITGTTTETTLTPIPVDILEFEDLLFHDNSAVMLPEVPGLDPIADNAPMTGVKAIGMAFLFAAMYPERGILITGHTASQSDVPESFRLSRERASCVMYMLQGNDARWALTCAGRHTVEDYKQILKYLHEYTGSWKDGDWECDPGDVDNSFNEATQTALNNFATHFNSDIADDSEEIAPLPATLGDIISEATDNRLSAGHWLALYSVYELMVCDFLGKTRTELADMSLDLNWVSDMVKMVGCGHSYAVPDSERGDDKIRSATDSRIELLIYQGNDSESDALVVCPTMPISTVHDLENDCPMWHERHFSRNYIGPGDRFAVVYHLKFRYYDRIKKDFQDIPGRVNVKAYKRDAAIGSTVEEIPCITQYQNGIHSVRVRFGEENPVFTDKWLYFGFEAPEHDGTPVVRMIHTSGPDATPVIVNRPDDWDTKTFAEKHQYYDLPMKWFSHNWHTRHESTHANDERFHEHIKDKRQLKPFGSNVTSQGEPLMFSLDDIVLMDSATGHDQNIQDADQLGTAKALCAGAADPGSRVKLFVVDSTTNQFKLWERPNEDRTSLTPPPPSSGSGGGGSGSSTTTRAERIRLERNLVSGMAPAVKVVHFRDGFYTVGDRRTTDQPGDWMDKTGNQGAYVVGARIALRDDPDRHKKWEMKYNHHEKSYTGDYDVHYFHQINLEGNHPVSLLIVCATMNFMLDPRQDPSAAAWTSASQNPGMSDVDNFVHQGVYNAQEYWNRKGYYFIEERDTGDAYAIIRRFVFFDERETFTMPLTELPTNTDFGTLSNHRALFGAGSNFRTAQRRTFGGPVKFVAFVCPDQAAGVNYGIAYAWAVRGLTSGAYTLPHSLMLLNKSAYQITTGIFAYNNTGYQEDGTRYGVFTLAHELGHVTSLSDEYTQDVDPQDSATPARMYITKGMPGFDQFFVQYNPSTNQTSMMYYNGAPRLHHCWYHLHLINKNSLSGGGLNDATWLNGKAFKVKFDNATPELIYKRHLNWTPSGTVSPPPANTPQTKDDIRQPMTVEERLRLPNVVSVSAAPDLSSVSAAHQTNFTHDASANTLTYDIAAGAMSTAERDAWRGAFTGDDNKAKVSRLYQKTQSLRRVHIAIYDVGQDESSTKFFHDNQTDEYHAVLVVRVMLSIKGDATEADWETDPEYTELNDKLVAIQQEWQRLNGSYRLTGGPAEFSRVFMYFIPGFADERAAGSTWSYKLTFQRSTTTFSVTVANAPSSDPSTVVTDASYDATAHRLSFEGRMTTGEKTQLRGLFTVAADQTAVDNLYQQSTSVDRLTSSTCVLNVPRNITADDLQLHFLNMAPGEDQLEALKFIETWVNGKLNASYTLERIPAPSATTTTP